MDRDDQCHVHETMNKNERSYFVVQLGGVLSASNKIFIWYDDERVDNGANDEDDATCYDAYDEDHAHDNVTVDDDQEEEKEEDEDEKNDNDGTDRINDEEVDNVAYPCWEDLTDVQDAVGLWPSARLGTCICK